MKAVNIGNRSFAATMIALGGLGFVYGDFAMNWQEVPNWVLGREVLAYLCAAIMFFCGTGLMLSRMPRLESAVLLVYLVLWQLLLRVPKVLIAPQVVVSWSGCAETAIFVAAGWALFAELFESSRDSGVMRFITGDQGIRGSRLLYGLALIPCGLAHFTYAKETADFIPEAWIPWHLGWAYLTGTAFLAAGIAILIRRRLAPLAATLSAVMMGVFTLMVWVPQVWSAPNARFQWTGLLISSALAAGGWAIADSYHRTTTSLLD